MDKHGSNPQSINELMHSLHTKNLKTKFMALKLDITKAFDKVEWQFLDIVMRRMGFSDKWCGQIQKCISTVSYSVLLNGEPTKTIFPHRGIRHGDPISPYMYIIYTEDLTSLIRQCIQRNQTHGYRASRGGPPISHLLFADDSLVLCRATEEECNKLMEVLKTYQDASGQEVNYTKSTITFSKGIPLAFQDALKQKT